MRRFVTYFNSLFLGIILGMIYVAIVHACPPNWQERICLSGIRISYEQARSPRN